MSDAFDPYCEWLGIPPTEQPPDYYRLLGIGRFENDRRVIEASADRQTAFVRGLQQGQQAPNAQGLLAELAAARACLLDPARRADYDSMLRSRSGSATAAGHTVARPAPRSELPPTSMPATNVGPPAGGSFVPSPGAGAAGAAWPPHAAGQAPVPGAPPPTYGTVPGPAAGPAGMSGGLPPGYGTPPPNLQPPPPGLPAQGLPPQAPPPGSPTQAPPVGPPTASPPVSGPPLTSGGVFPNISTGDTGRTTAHTSDASPRDEDEPNRQRQVWLLLAIVGVVVVGAALSLVIVLLGLASPREQAGRGNDAETPATMTGTLVEQQPDGALQFAAADAVIHGETATRGLVAGRSVITNWRSPHDWIAWDFRVERPAMFHVELVYAASTGHGGRFSVAIGDTIKEASVRDSGGADNFITHEIGYMTVRRAGRYRLQLRAIQQPAGQLMDLRSIRLTPEDIGHVR